MHEFPGMGRGAGRFHSYLGVVNFKPRYHSFIGMGRPQQSTGMGGASAPHIPTPYVFHNDEEQMEATRRRAQGLMYDPRNPPPTRQF